MKTLGYYNGMIGELDEMSVPMNDRACYFGDGVYDVTYTRNRKLMDLEEHIHNLFRSASKIRMIPDFSKSFLERVLKELAEKPEDGNLWVYIQISRGSEQRNHPFPKNEKTNLWIMMRPGNLQPLQKDFRCILQPDKRHGYCNVKSLNLLPNILAAEQAVQNDADEAILYRGKNVTECSHSNLFILKDQTLYTHPDNGKIYPGTGRNHLLQVCRKEKIDVMEKAFSVNDLFTADEVLLTSASVLCNRVTEVNRRKVGGGDSVTLRFLQQKLYDRMEGSY